MSRRFARLVLTTAAALIAVSLAVPTAQAAAGAAPVTQDDAVTLDAGDIKVVDVLANDADPDDPSGDDLAICRVVVPDGSPLSYDIQTAGLAVATPISDYGTFTLTYYACDYDYLTPATLTVTVKKVPVVKAKNTSRAYPGHVSFTNPGDQSVKVTYTVPSGKGPEGKVVVPSRTTTTVTVTKPRIVFVATRRSGAIVGYGTVKNIRLAKKKHGHP